MVWHFLSVTELLFNMEDSCELEHGGSMVEHTVVECTGHQVSCS